MNIKTLRVVVPLVVLALAGIGFVAGAPFGTLSSFGWRDVSLLCPLGALTTMIAERTLVPRAIVSLVAFAAIAVLVGRAFCAWACPVPLVARIRGLFGKPSGDARATKAQVPSGQLPAGRARASAPLTDDERALLGGCGSCGSKRRGLDTRHFVLGGSVLSAAVFGFPVFCLICPIGLTFATVLLLVRAFGFGDASWGLVVVPALLFVEVVVFRKWCHAICPLGALMSLVARANRTLRPTADAASCVEAKGGTCGRCAEVCPEGIDPRDPARGTDLSECTRCMACVEACPAHALSLPMLPAKAAPDARGEER